MNLFEWIRNGVRQAVLMGVADAVGDIGQPPESEDIAAHLLNVIRTTSASQAGAKRLSGKSRTKRLGRSLNQIHALSEQTE